MSVPFRKRTQHQQDMAWIWLTKKKSSNEIFFCVRGSQAQSEEFLETLLTSTQAQELSRNLMLSKLSDVKISIKTGRGQHLIHPKKCLE